MCINPLAWWWTHEGQFQNVAAILAKQMLGILGFQVETKRMFSLASVLKTLRCCHLQVENLDKIIIVVKNWSNDPCLNRTTDSNFKDYVKSEVALVEENYEFIEESEYFEELPCQWLHKWINLASFFFFIFLTRSAYDFIHFSCSSWCYRVVGLQECLCCWSSCNLSWPTFCICCQSRACFCCWSSCNNLSSSCAIVSVTDQDAPSSFWCNFLGDWV